MCELRWNIYSRLKFFPSLQSVKGVGGTKDRNICNAKDSGFDDGDNINVIFIKLLFRFSKGNRCIPSSRNTPNNTFKARYL